MPTGNTLIYLIRKDLRVSDNPIFHHLATSTDHGFTHLLPVFVFPPHQIEVSGFIKDGSKSPFPEARSQVGKYWRCGPHRAKFIGESVWNLKTSLEYLESGLLLRVGLLGNVVQNLIDGLHQKQLKVGAVWATGLEGTEEKGDEEAVSTICEKEGVDFKLWVDEKYFIDDRDLAIENSGVLPDVFTEYRKKSEPLREKPRATLPKPEKASLPPMIPESELPAQEAPFEIPTTYDAFEKAIVDPVKNFVPNPPPFPENTASVHPFKGGEDSSHERLAHLLKSEVMVNYKDTRNGLLGRDFSTKLSAFLAQGCITARQIHEEMAKYEDGKDSAYENVKGYGEGENDGTKAVRFELLWRDFMRLWTQKVKSRLFRLEGYRRQEHYKDGEQKPKWKTADEKHALPAQEPGPAEVTKILERFNAGTTGMGFIDASQRELIHSGYTSNRARQNVASFLAKHLGIDWRYGAEWYEMLLVDYDVSSNWANWQYVAGVGNDPRGPDRIFNPVKQAFDYDKEGLYVKAWVPEVRNLEKLENVFQAWTTPEEELEKAGLVGNVMVTDPIKRIEFFVEGKPRNSKRPYGRRRGSTRRPQQGNSPEGQSTGGQSSAPAQQPTGPPSGPSGAPPNRGGYPRGGGYRGGYRGRGGGGYRERGYGGGRGAFRGGYMGPPRPSWAPPANAGA